jgi:hypothetical protein
MGTVVMNVAGSDLATVRAMKSSTESIASGATGAEKFTNQIGCRSTIVALRSR